MIQRPEIVVPDEHVLREHYKEHANEDFFPSLIGRMKDRPILVIRVASYDEDIVSDIKRWVGATDCREVGTLRYKYGRNLQFNGIHASKDKNDAARELALWDQFCQEFKEKMGHVDPTC